MKNVIKHTSIIILALAAIISAWFLLNNLQPLSPGLYSFVIVCIVGVVIFLKLFATNFLRTIRAFLVKAINYRYFTAIAIPIITLLAIIVRLYFYARFSYAPVSDPVTFYDAAQQIASGQGIHGDSYPVFFPFLAAYDNILGLAMKVISNPWLATILLNTVFDIGAAIIAYFLVKKLSKPASKLPILVFAIWLLSPFNILFSVLSLPIVIVNFFIIATILLVYLLVEKVVAKRVVSSLLLALLLGITMGIGDCFRPIFTVVIVAVFLLFTYIIFTRHDKKRLLLLLGSSFVLVLALFFGMQKLDLAFIAKETGLTPPTNDSGWSIYIGSNSATNGTWSLADQNRMSQQICKNQTSFQDCHNKLEKVGIERYKSYGIIGTLNLFARKLYIFSSDQSNTYNANDSVTNYANSKTQKAMGVYIILFLITLFYLSTRLLYLAAKTVKSKSEIAPIILFITLLMVGFFFSDMFVETAERYAQIVYPLFIVLSVLSLGSFKKRPRLSTP